MSVRRLAEDTVQPGSFAFSDENAGWAERVIRNYPEGRQQSAVIPLLMRAQEQEGWVTRAAIEHVADMLHMPLIRVLEVATFYTQYQLKPVGTKAHVQVCGTTPCMLRGSDALKAVCRSRIHPEQLHPNEAGTLSWEEVECLGACVNAPMVMIFKDTYEDLTPERLAEIIDLFESDRGGEVRPGPQIDRHLSAPVGGLTSLTEDYEDRAGHGPTADDAPPQGPGAGSEASVPPSTAGKPDTYAEETDPTIASPGKAENGNADEAAETAASVDPAEGADRAGAGETGGTEQGHTGAQETEDDAETGTTPRGRAAGGELFKGEFREQERVSESRVVPDHARSGSDAAEDVPPRGIEADLTGRRDDPGAVAEAKRDNSDVEPGPVADDHFASRAEEAREPSTDDTVAGEGSLETRPHHSIGRKPVGLLDQPDGPKDDLKQIKGVGPVIEQKLNELGVFHVRQIAAWDNDELMWIDDHLNFRGRALRDRWIEQARGLQAGSPGPAGA